MHAHKTYQVLNLFEHKTLTINEKVFGELDVDKVDRILHDYLEMVWRDEKDADTEKA